MKRTPLKRVSNKRRKDMAKYSVLREDHLKRHPMCHGWLLLNEFSAEEIRNIQEIAVIALWQGMDVPAIAARRKERMTLLDLPQWCPRSFDLHHSRGRGKNYIKTEYFMALSRVVHQWAHDHANLAREYGLLA